MLQTGFPSQIERGFPSATWSRISCKIRFPGALSVPAFESLYVLINKYFCAATNLIVLSAPFWLKLYCEWVNLNWVCPTSMWVKQGFEIHILRTKLQLLEYKRLQMPARLSGWPVKQIAEIPSLKLFDDRLCLSHCQVSIWDVMRINIIFHTCVRIQD